MASIIQENEGRQPSRLWVRSTGLHFGDLKLNLSTAAEGSGYVGKQYLFSL